MVAALIATGECVAETIVDNNSKTMQLQHVPLEIVPQRAIRTLHRTVKRKQLHNVYRKHTQTGRLPIAFL